MEKVNLYTTLVDDSRNFKIKLIKNIAYNDEQDLIDCWRNIIKANYFNFLEKNKINAANYKFIYVEVTSSTYDTGILEITTTLNKKKEFATVRVNIGMRIEKRKNVNNYPWWDTDWTMTDKFFKSCFGDIFDNLKSLGYENILPKLNNSKIFATRDSNTILKAKEFSTGKTIQSIEVTTENGITIKYPLCSNETIMSLGEKLKKIYADPSFDTLFNDFVNKTKAEILPDDIFAIGVTNEKTIDLTVRIYDKDFKLIRLDNAKKLFSYKEIFKYVLEKAASPEYYNTGNVIINLRQFFEDSKIKIEKYNTGWRFDADKMDWHLTSSSQLTRDDISELEKAYKNAVNDDEHSSSFILMRELEIGF